MIEHAECIAIDIVGNLVTECTGTVTKKQTKTTTHFPHQNIDLSDITNRYSTVPYGRGIDYE